MEDEHHILCFGCSKCQPEVSNIFAGFDPCSTCDGCEKCEPEETTHVIQLGPAMDYSLTKTSDLILKLIREERNYGPNGKHYLEIANEIDGRVPASNEPPVFDSTAALMTILHEYFQKLSEQNIVADPEAAMAHIEAELELATIKAKAR